VHDSLSQKQLEDRVRALNASLQTAQSRYDLEVEHRIEWQRDTNTTLAQGALQATRLESEVQNLMLRLGEINALLDEKSHPPRYGVCVCLSLCLMCVCVCASLCV
jgi:hypothetical protein